MSLEAQIVEWGFSRPPWQKAVLKRVARGEVLSETDYDQLVDALVASKQFEDTNFSLADLPEVHVGDPSVRLISIAHPQHVNALASDKPLTFEVTGLTVAYGDNASGKSGYARLLKRIARARHQEEVLSDVFRDTVAVKPKALVTVMVGDEEVSLDWPESSRPELQRILFYDGACGVAYIAAESDFPYRPSALFVMEGLIQACIAVRSRIDGKLEENARLTKTLPVVDADTAETDIGKFLQKLSGDSSLETLDALLEKLEASAEIIDNLKKEEARLQIADRKNEREKLTRDASKFDALRTHIENLNQALGNDAIEALEAEHQHLKALEEAAQLLAKSFESQPLGGVGTSAWKELWESARLFSETQAYPDQVFPVVAENARCVFCQQPLLPEASQRLSRFERFVQDDTQTRLRTARVNWDTRVHALATLRTAPVAIESNLKDLESEHEELVRRTQELLDDYEAARTQIVNALSSSEPLSLSNLKPSESTSRLETAAAAARTAAESLSNPLAIRQRLASITTTRKEFELLQAVKKQRPLIIDEIARLKESAALEAIKSTAATGGVTKKILELAEDNITEVVRDSFTRETDRLNLERVTIAKTRGDKGTVLHQPKLVGARQNVTLPRVFSEGERTALGLAAFFTEAHLDASKSALVLDDPVSSLDHIRRERVAMRLAALAETRQVVVFTHDLSFVADLKREANGRGVSLGERWVIRRGRGEESRPGTCSSKHPWKAESVSERLGDLRSELARIKRECIDWDQTTYEDEVATWAGKLSETWERIFSQEIVGPILAKGGLEVRPKMLKILVSFTDADEREFQASYSRVSKWARRHDKSIIENYVEPDITTLEDELKLVDQWFKRVKAYKS